MSFLEKWHEIKKYREQKFEKSNIHLHLRSRWQIFRFLVSSLNEGNIHVIVDYRVLHSVISAILKRETQNLGTESSPDSLLNLILKVKVDIW